MVRICVILTGGTICSLPDENGKNQSNAAQTGTRLTEYYLHTSASRYRSAVSFDVKALSPDILSENMTVAVWGEILAILREIDPSEYKGVIILHGTDTLAYTASFLSLALSGLCVPVCMVSAQLRLGEVKDGVWTKEEKTNGYINFKAAVELIMNGIAPNLYAVYRNEKNEENKEHAPGDLLVHFGSHLLQCPNASNNFHSRDEKKIKSTKNAKYSGQKWQKSDDLYKKVQKIDDAVLLIEPHTGLNYDRLCLENIRAIVHGTYHSESVCIGRAEDACRAEGKTVYTLAQIRESDRPYSILSLLHKAKEKKIPVFLAPCDLQGAGYGTTFNACKEGAFPLRGITLEAAYAKAVLACALGLEGEDLVGFMRESLNFEMPEDALQE